MRLSTFISTAVRSRCQRDTAKPRQRLAGRVEANPSPTLDSRTHLRWTRNLVSGHENEQGVQLLMDEAALMDFQHSDLTDNPDKLAKLAGEIAAIDRVLRVLQND